MAQWSESGKESPSPSRLRYPELPRSPSLVVVVLVVVVVVAVMVVVVVALVVTMRMRICEH